MLSGRNIRDYRARGSRVLVSRYKQAAAFVFVLHFFEAQQYVQVRYDVRPSAFIPAFTFALYKRKVLVVLYGRCY